jgi:hypothetical protein
MEQPTTAVVISGAFCEHCQYESGDCDDEPCKSCTVKPSNFEEKNENQGQ